MNKLRKTGLIISAIVMTLFLCVMIKSEAFAREVENVTYIDENGNEKTLDSCTLLDRDCFNNFGIDEANLANPGTYFINEDSIHPEHDKSIRDIKSITMQGDVTFIVADNTNLSLKRILFTADNTSLTIYAQSTGTSRGKIEVRSSGFNWDKIAIGGMSGTNGHKLTINGGDVVFDALPSEDGDGYLYGVYLGTQDSTLTVNGGTLQVLSKESYAVFADYVTLNGGEVYANRYSDGSTPPVTYGGIYVDKQLSINMTNPETDLLYTDFINNPNPDMPLTKVVLKPNYKWYYETSKALVTTDNLRCVSDTRPGSAWYYNQPIKPMPAGVAQHSLSLGGTIGVNFYVYFPGENGKADYDSDTVMKFEIQPEGRTKEIPVSEVTKADSDGFYCFTFNVKALEMADEITASLVKGGEVISQDKYTVEKYYRSVRIDGPGYNLVDEKVRDLTYALDGYGYYAQHYLQKNAKTPWAFNEKHYEMGTDGKYYHMYDVAGSIQNEARAYFIGEDTAPEVTQKSDAIDKINFSLIMDEDTAIKLYVSVKDPEMQIDSVACKVNETTKDVTFEKVSDSQYTILIGNIVAQDLKNKYKVTITDSTNEETIICLSPFSYAHVVMCKSGYEQDEAFENAMIMMYNYNKTAIAYLNH